MWCPSKPLHDSFCKHSYSFPSPPKNLYLTEPFVPSKDDRTIDELVYEIITNTSKFNYPVKFYRRTFTLQGVKRYCLDDIKRKKASFLHGWKNKSSVKRRKKFDENSKRPATLSPNYYKKFTSSPFIFPRVTNIDIKTICRNFILAERCISLLQAGCLNHLMDIEFDVYKNYGDFLTSLPEKYEFERSKVHFHPRNGRNLSLNSKRPVSIFTQVSS